MTIAGLDPVPPLHRVTVALELALEEDRPADVLASALVTLGVRATVDEQPVADVVEELVDTALTYVRLEADGTAGLDDDLPPGVSRSRVLEAELERLAGEVRATVTAIAATLR